MELEVQDADKMVAEMVAKGAQVVPVPAPLIGCSSFRLSLTPTECLLQLQRQRPVNLVTPDQRFDIIQNEVVAVLSLSPQSLKDLVMLASEQVEKYEAQWGTIETEFTVSRKSEGK